MFNPILYVFSSHYRNEMRCKGLIKRIKKRIHRRCEEVGDPQWWNRHDITTDEGLDTILGINSEENDLGNYCES